jgi:hypothetical protein
MFPVAGESWLSNLWSAPELVRTIGISAYLSQHYLWAIHLAGIAALSGNRSAIGIRLKQFSTRSIVIDIGPSRHSSSAIDMTSVPKRSHEPRTQHTAWISDA